MLSTIKVIPAVAGKAALTFAPFEITLIILFIGINNSKVMPIPITLESVPIINVSALNTCVILYS